MSVYRKRNIELVLVLLCLFIKCFAAKEKYPRFAEYFEMHPVEKCPMTSKEWLSASKRLHCNVTHGYNCLPEEMMSSLVEFCYPLGNWIQIPKGNCPRLALSYRLKYHQCHNFTCGCPEHDYYNNEIYKYPACLKIFKKCFSSDITCIKDHYPKAEQRSEQKRNGKSKCQCTVYIALFSITIVMATGSIIVNVWCCWKRRIHREVPPFARYLSIPQDELIVKHPIVGDIEKYLLVDYTIENAELYNLLKIQCLNGVEIGFKYVNRSRVQDANKTAIFHQRDEKGCTLLHYAAQGGSIIIFKEILKTPNIKIGIKCFRGQTVLHFAVRYKKNKMSEYLISEHREHFIESGIDLLSGPTLELRGERNVESQFEPFHWIAWNGDTWLHHLWKKSNISMKGLTKNGLSILDIACINNQYEFCKNIIEHEPIEINKLDASEWNIAHYAAMWNNVKLLQFLARKHKSLVMALTQSKKTTLHLACQQGHFESVKYLTTEFKSLLHCTDDLEWNALHFAAKGGNTEIIELLLTEGLKLDSLTKDKKTLLHIASISKEVDVCEIVAKAFQDHEDHEELMNKKTSNQGWTAAHYVGVEKNDIQKQQKIIDIFHTYGMNLQERTDQGFSILDIAIIYLDKELIELIVSQDYRAILDIDGEVLKQGKAHATGNEPILNILSNALKEITQAGEIKRNLE